jgi:ribosomal protein L40E
LIEINKLKSAISDENDAINATKIRIGDKIFAMFNAGEAIPDSMKDDVQTIISHLAKITELEAKIDEIKAASEAEKASRAAEAGQTSASGRFCTGCGASLAEGAMFCGKCGKKQE